MAEDGQTVSSAPSTLLLQIEVEKAQWFFDKMSRQPLELEPSLRTPGVGMTRALLQVGAWQGPCPALPCTSSGSSVLEQQPGKEGSAGASVQPRGDASLPNIWKELVITQLAPLLLQMGKQPRG